MLNHAGQPTLGVPVAQGAVNQLHLIVVQPLRQTRSRAGKNGMGPHGSRGRRPNASRSAVVGALGRETRRDPG
jgi:hypothetical protein